MVEKVETKRKFTVILGVKELNVSEILQVRLLSNIYIIHTKSNCEFPLCFHFSDQSGNKAETEEDNVQQGG